MKFVKVGRNDLIEQLKEYIDLLKKCPKDMEFHTIMEFCGIDKTFLEIVRKRNEKRMKEQAREQQKQQEEGNI